MESILDFQFEVLTTYLNDGGKEPCRSKTNNAHAYLGAPYGIYQTQDGWLALAMGDIIQLGDLLKCDGLKKYEDRKTWFSRRDEIKGILVQHLKTASTGSWLAVLEEADIWCAEVLNWEKLRKHSGFLALEMIQTVERSPEVSLQTTRCPIRIDGEILKSKQGAPQVGQHNGEIEKRYRL